MLCIDKWHKANPNALKMYEGQSYTPLYFRLSLSCLHTRNPVFKGAQLIEERQHMVDVDEVEPGLGAG